MRRLLFFCSLALLGTSFPLAADDEEVLAIVVSNTQIERTLNFTDLTLIYRRKKLVWDDGDRLQPVNLPTDNSLRRAFSQRVLGSSPEGLARYWNVMYFHGVSPPHVLASEEAVLRFVLDTPGAIGYVTACKADARVKTVLWLLPKGKVSTQPPVLNCSQD